MNDDFDALARDLVLSSVEIRSGLREVIQQGMSDIKDQWRENARMTSGSHGKWYPDSITYETRLLAGEVVGEVGPDANKKQGSMGRGFEFGSRNQPPHLDGVRATERAVPSMERRFEATIGFLLP